MNPNFSVDTESLGSIEVINVRGELDQATVPELRRSIDSAIERATAVFIDMSGCEFIDSTGLSLLLETRRTLDDDGRGFALCCPSAEVARLLELTGIDAAVGLFESRDEAIASLDSAGSAG